MGSSESSRTYQLSVLVKEAQDFYVKWFDVRSWSKWLKNLVEEKEGRLKNVQF